MIAAAATKKKAALFKKADAVLPNRSSKRPRPGVEPVVDAPGPLKRTGERKVYIINIQTTETTILDTPAPSAQDILEQRPRLTVSTSPAPPVLETVERAAASTTPITVDPPIILPGGKPAAPVPPAVPVPEVVVEKQFSRHSKRTAIVLEEVRMV